MRGDPHIVTLDGLQYTFNGKGEFTLIGTPDDSFTLQGRMIPAADTNGSGVLATVFSAIVGKQGDSDSIQFELTENGTTAFVNNEPVDFSVLSEQEFNNVTVSDLGGLFPRFKQRLMIICGLLAAELAEEWFQGLSKG